MSRFLGRDEPVMLKRAVWVGGLVPFALATMEAADGTFAGQAQAVAHLGIWSLRFLVAALAAAPIAHLLKRPAITPLRREFGRLALVYALGHVGLCLAVSGFLRWPLDALRERPDFIPGFIALAIMLAAAVAARPIRPLVLLVAPLTILHFAMPTGLEVLSPYLYGAAVAVLIGWRLRHRVLASGQPSRPGDQPR